MHLLVYGEHFQILSNRQINVASEGKFVG